MTEYQRSVYEIAIQREWMSENAFLMAYNDLICILKVTHISTFILPNIIFMEWLFD